jgi:putative metallohydrolase (TIGR04338 family)
VNPRERQLSLYAGEEAALAGTGRVFRDLREVRAYLDELVGTDWWADRWPHIEAIRAARTRSGRFSGYAVEGSREIRLRTRRQVELPSVGSLAEPVVLHEVAHVVTPGAGHGPAFVDALLALVRERLGFPAYGALLAELRRRHVVGR